MNIGRALLFRLRHSRILFAAVKLFAAHAPFFLSLFLHAFVVLVCVVDVSWFSEKPKENIVSVPVMTVDLSNIPVTSITNLPPELRLSKKKAGEPAKKSVRTSAYSRPNAAPKPSAPVQKTTGTADAALTVKKLNSVLDNVLNKSAPEQKKTPAKAKQNGGFKTLLASVDGLRAPASDASAYPDYLEDEALENQGIKGGQGGSYARELSVSQKDLLGMKLRACWNIDAGVRGVQNMLVEIRAYLNKDGSVSDVKILNAKRYKKDAAFRSVAESARRAVYICAEKEDSPFLLFPQHYAEDYENWKTLLLRFNPVDKEVL